MYRKLDYMKIANKAIKGFFQASRYNNTTSDVDPILKELVLTRASQLNGCGYCLSVHTRDAIKIGETHQRLHVVAAWRENNLFTKKEKLALELTEKITKLHESNFSDKFFEKYQEYFTEKEFVDLVVLIITINVWNTLNVVFPKDILAE